MHFKFDNATGLYTVSGDPTKWVKMLTVANSDYEQTLRAADARGGFVWWYADLRSEPGEGLVVLWSLGLPFLPGAREARQAKERPAVSIAHYSGGRQQLYLLQHYGREQASIDVGSGSGTIGKSVYEIEQTPSEVQLRVQLEEPMPHLEEPLTGELIIRGRRPTLPGPTDSTAVHIWTPRTLHAAGSAELHYGGKDHVLNGTGYFDSNASTTPLHSQQIASWRWGRLSFPTYSIVFYEVEETGGQRLRYMYRQTGEGEFSRLVGRLSFLRESRATYGLNVAQEIHLVSSGCTVCADATAQVESGPFYCRALLSAQDQDGAQAHGFFEVVVPDRIDTPWQRPLVRMRTHQVGGTNSPFLPLFNGPRAGRASRLMASLLASKALP